MEELARARVYLSGNTIWNNEAGDGAKREAVGR